MFSGFGGFGGGKKSDEAVAAAVTSPVETPAATDKSTTQKGASVHGFDPSALERAARAARELDASKNSKNALQLIQAQEATKQKEYEVERAKYQAMQQELAIRRAKEEEQAAARTLDRQTEHDRARAEYKDQLERKRLVDQINAQRQIQEEERQKAEESLKRQEAIRRKTLEYEAELRQQTEMARVQAETAGRIRQERENHDLIIDNKKLEMREYRETVLESIKLAGTTIGTGLRDFLSDRERLANVAGTLTAVAFGVYFARTSIGITGRFVEARLGKPTLVRETSRPNVSQFFRAPQDVIKSIFSKPTGQALNNVVLERSLETRLQRISQSTGNTKTNRAPYRHLLLWGPPGTGKTMFAKGLARSSGMHYAIMTGGDIAPLGRDAVTEIHKLFDWANSTSKGVIIFVDEADAFLRKRSTEKISEDMRNALNAFLYRTGEASTKFMVVYASNQPEQFDWAINDRIDELVEFALPKFDERLRMITQYIDQYILNVPTGARTITASGIDEAFIREMAEHTKGFSGREISKLAIAWQAAAYGNANALINPELMKDVLIDAKKGKKQKEAWLSEKQIEHITAPSSTSATAPNKPKK